MNCDILYDSIFKGESTRGYDLFELAACFLGGFDPEKLRAMLRSADMALVSDGLFIANEIGSLASTYVDDFRTLAESADEEISMRASDLLRIYERPDAGEGAEGKIKGGG